MSLATVYSRAEIGIEAPLVHVEVHLSSGLPSLSIVGLPETSVRESRDRVRCAILNAGFEFPRRRITINLAPADLPKYGSRYDLAIAIGVLSASRQIAIERLSQFEFAAELALGGELRPVPGLLTVSLAASQRNRQLVVAGENAAECRLIERARVFAAENLLQVTACLNGQDESGPQPTGSLIVRAPVGRELSGVVGQERAKRALEVAAAGEHSLLMSGPPGTGKTLLANCLPALLPDLNEHEAVETAAIQSLSCSVDPVKHWRVRPLRAPHHGVSSAALVGGGSIPRPGEISLAHNGILFLDELPEFSRHVLESLREPMESGKILVSRVRQYAEFPARFQLVAAMNPCPCGYLGDEIEECRCTEEQVQRYRARISGPLMDRIDLQLEVPAIPPGILLARKKSENCESSATVKSRIIESRQRQLERSGCLNSRLDSDAVERHCVLCNTAEKLLSDAMQRLRLSARSYHRILKMARTIADIEASTTIIDRHLAEAIQYRVFDKANKGVRNL